MLLRVSFECLLHIVRKSSVFKDPVDGVRLCTYIFRHGLQSSSFLGNHLVFALVEAVRIREAHHVFKTLTYRTETAWNTLIVGCVNHGDPHHALVLYDDMRNENSICPAAQTLVALVKACTKLKDVKRGVQMHAEINKHRWYGENMYIGSTLINMYAKCGYMSKAQEVFDMLSTQNIVAWTSLIGGYIEHEQGAKALQCFNTMQVDGIAPDAPAFVLGIKACGSIRALSKGQELHAEVERQVLLDRNPFLGSALVDMYVKCNAFTQAHELVNKMKLQNCTSWNALISGFTEQEHGNKALHCFREMQQSGISPDVITFTCCVKACAITGDLDMGQAVHAELERQRLLETDIVACNALVDMYMKCGQLAAAHELFNKTPSPNVVSWNSLIGGYVDNGHGIDALQCFRNMESMGVSPNRLTLVCGLQACILLVDADLGQELHAEIESKGFLLQNDTVVCNSLINMYAKCGLLAAAQKVFDKLAIRDTASWTVLIAGYAENGHGEEALEKFEKMELEGVSPNPATFVCILRACADFFWEEEGFELHAEIERRALLSGEVGTSIIDLYIRFGLLVIAREVFDRLTFKDEDSWNTLLVGYAEHGYNEEVIELFDRMQIKGPTASAMAFVWSLKSCGNLGALEKGQEIHSELERIGWLKRNPSIGTVLIDMYIKCGFLAKAKDVFDKLPVRDVVSWTALIAGYVDNDHGEEALECLKLMQCEGVTPNDVTLLCSLKACGSVGATDYGRELHVEIERKGLLVKEPLVGNTLVDMYARCGMLTKAQQVFERLPVRNVISWTALMAGYAQLGLSDNVFELYEQMRLECVSPDPVMFVVILNTCSRRGLVDRSTSYFTAMSKEFGIVPIDEHHYCMLDLLGRVGQLDKAEEMIMKHSQCPDLVAWHTVLSGCRNFGNVEFGRHAFDKALLLDNKDAVSFVLMSRILGEHSLEA